MKRSILAIGLLLVVSVLLGAPAHAQVGTARGKVLDDQGQPVADAVVELDFLGGITRKLNTKSNKKGEFIQVGLTPGPYRITVNKDGYAPASTDVRISLGDPTLVPDFRLQTKAKAEQAAAQKTQQDVGPAFQKAIELTQAGQYPEAEAAYKDILTKYPTLPEVHYNLGYVYMQRKDWPSAEAAYKKALELKPGYSDAVLALAKVYQESGQPDKALALMSQAGASGEGDGKVQFNLGIFYLNQNKVAEAEAAFKKAETADPSNPEVQYHLATLALQNGKTDECIQRLEKYLTMSPKSEQNVTTAKGLLQALKPKK